MLKTNLGMSLKIIKLTLKPHLPGDSELTGSSGCPELISRPGVGGTKPIFSVPLFSQFFRMIKTLFTCIAGLGRVPDLRVRVQVRVLVICVSTSTSTSTWLLHEYEYWLMSTSTSTSTGLWSTFHIGSSFSFFGLWQGSPQILKNLGQSSNYPLSIYICLIILCNLIHWHFNICIYICIATCWLSWLTFTTCCQFKNRKQKLCNIMKCVENSVFFKSEVKIFIY